MAGYPFYTPRTSGPPPLIPTSASSRCSTDTSRRRNTTTNPSQKSRFIGGGNASNLNPSMPFPPTPPAAAAAAAATAATAPSPSNNDPSPTPYETPPFPSPLPTPHPHVTIDTVRTAHIPSLMRTTGLLLPIRYPNSFYSTTITDPVIASVSRVALYHDTTNPTHTGTTGTPSSDKVVGGIRCRLEPIPYSFPTAKTLYIQTIHLLSPYRGRGVATSLLESIIYDDNTASDATAPRRVVSPLVKHYNIRSVTAHVLETNEDALAWYTSRGFTVQEGVVEGYYRRLKPGGARIVKLDLDWDSGKDLSTSPNVCTEDEDWEKVEVDEVEKLEDYDTIDRTVDLDENARKKAKMR